MIGEEKGDEPVARKGFFVGHIPERYGTDCPGRLFF